MAVDLFLEGTVDVVESLEVLFQVRQSPGSFEEQRALVQDIQASLVQAFQVDRLLADTVLELSVLPLFVGLELAPELGLEPELVLQLALHTFAAATEPPAVADIPEDIAMDVRDVDAFASSDVADTVNRAFAADSGHIVVAEDVVAVVVEPLLPLPLPEHVVAVASVLADNRTERKSVDHRRSEGSHNLSQAYQHFAVSSEFLANVRDFLHERIVVVDVVGDCPFDGSVFQWNSADFQVCLILNLLGIYWLGSSWVFAAMFVAVAVVLVVRALQIPTDFVVVALDEVDRWQEDFGFVMDPKDPREENRDDVECLPPYSTGPPSP